uniref:Uncharacterized protein n=1 Tax=Cannabis sativa TaxID=3483 RepID=A0A803QPZ4_CANSA
MSGNRMMMPTTLTVAPREILAFTNVELIIIQGGLGGWGLINMELVKGRFLYTSLEKRKKRYGGQLIIDGTSTQKLLRIRSLPVREKTKDFNGDFCLLAALLQRMGDRTVT